MANHVNIELKASNINALTVEKYLLGKEARYIGEDNQKDTYFTTGQGRFKLREGNIENSLIFYNRSDNKGLKTSNVSMMKLDDTSHLRDILSKSNGIKVVVSKKRKIYFIDNVKFHIDQVDLLGDFVEIEAIDKVGDLGVDHITSQCEFYKNELGITPENIIDCSYSDLIIKKGSFFREKINPLFVNFMDKLYKGLDQKNIDISSYFIDHACFRVESLEEYHNLKESFNLIGDLLVESLVGGRSISTYKLFHPLVYKDIEIDIVELPSPKNGSTYKTGFEHVECVISKEFKELENDYPSLKFDWKGANKSFNPELRLELSNDLSIKFHHQSLEYVVEVEKNLSNT